MNAREFVDTNIFIYAFDRSAGRKREAAADLIQRLWAEHAGCVSLQVLQEFYVTATRKLTMPADDALLQVERLGAWTLHRPTFEDVTGAIRMHRSRQISFWDALILRSASRLGCSVIWSEDLADGQKWESVLVRNPFKG